MRKKSFIFKIIIAVILVISLIFMAGCSKAVATVNDMKVTQQEVDEYIDFVLSQYSGDVETLTEENMNELEVNVIDSILVTKLMQQYAGENNLTVTQEEVDQRLSSMASSFDDEEGFNAYLEENNIDRDIFERELKNQLLTNKIYSEVTVGIYVTEEQVRDYYDENVETMFTTPEMVRVSHIVTLFPWIKDESIEESEQGKKEAKDKIEYVKEQLDNGADFAEMAIEYSEDEASSEAGGDLGFVSKDQLVGEFADAAFDLEKNETSDIVETTYGYHLIMLVDRSEEEVQDFEDVKDDISAALTEEYKNTKWEEFILALIDDADIEYLTDIEGTLND